MILNNLLHLSSMELSVLKASLPIANTYMHILVDISFQYIENLGMQ